MLLKKLKNLALIAGILSPALVAAEVATGPDAERREELRRMLLNDCATCHGEALRGDLGPELSNKTLAGRSEDSLVLTILEGHEETAMPPWWWTLNESEARWLVRFIRGTEN